MNKREFWKLLKGSVTPEQKRATAYHEAGHAAILWMFGNLSDLVCINMRGNLGFQACVTSRKLNIAKLHQDPDPMPVWLRIQAKQQMMHDLAGYAAESRLSTPQDGAWLDAQLNEGEWEYDETEDIHKTLRIAKAVYGDNGRAWVMVHRMASWTDEALSYPRLWAVVEALAEQLLTVKTRMSGNRACRIMGDAWGETRLPYMKMGRRWRRRFHVELGRKAK